MSEQRRSAIVTGAGSGIGFAATVRLARHGFDVFAVDVDVADLEESAMSRVEPVALDVTDRAGVEALVERVHAHCGRIDLLVNNAAISQPGAIECVPEAAVRRQFEVNVFGYMHFLQAVVPRMRGQRSGRIINVTSAIGKLPLPGFGWYGATKHAIEGLSDSLREEVLQFGIDVVVVAPGVIASPFLEHQNAMLAAVEHPDDYASVRAAVVDGVGRVPATKPDVVGDAILEAATAARPPRRIAVPLDAKLGVLARRLLGDRLLYRVIRKLAGIPGRPARR